MGAAILESLQALPSRDAAAYRAQRDASAAFSLLRRRAEEAGIFVLFKGNLGSYVLDANVLIDPYRDYYPIAKVPELWEWLLEIGTRDRNPLPQKI